MKRKREHSREGATHGTQRNSVAGVDRSASKRARLWVTAKRLIGATGSSAFFHNHLTGYSRDRLRIPTRPFRRRTSENTFHKLAAAQGRKAGPRFAGRRQLVATDVAHSRKRRPVRPSTPTILHSQALRIKMRMSRMNEPSEDGPTTTTCYGQLIADMNATRPRQADLRNRVAISLHAVDYKCEVLAFHVNARHKKSKKGGAYSRRISVILSHLRAQCFGRIHFARRTSRSQGDGAADEVCASKYRTSSTFFAPRHFVSCNSKQCRYDAVVDHAREAPDATARIVEDDGSAMGPI